jgi:hypothetical protein
MTEVIYLSEGLSQRKTSLLTLCWTLALLWTVIPSTARRPHKSPAHTVKDLNHLRLLPDFAPEHFVPSEPLILHRFPYPSTPSAKYFLLLGCWWNPASESVSTGEENNSVHPGGWEGVYTLFFHRDDKSARCYPLRIP